MILRCVAAVHRSCCITRAAAFHSFVQAAAAARIEGGRDIVQSAECMDGVSVLCHLIADANSVNKRNWE
jgi:hypothetical protein